MRTLIKSCLALVIFSGPVYAKATEWDAAGPVKTRLLVDNRSSAAPTKEIKGAVEIDLSPNWHTYWRTPGDTGLAPEFNWKKSLNVKNIKIHWPAPKRFEQAGFYSFGFKDQLVLPFTASLENPDKAFTLSSDVKVMVCNEICVPKKMTVSLSVKPGEKADNNYSSEIQKAFRKIPHKGDLNDLKIHNVVFGLGKMVVTAESSRGFADETDLFVEIPGVSVSAPPEIIYGPRSSGGKPRLARFIISSDQDSENLSSKVQGKSVRLTLTNEGRAIEKIYEF